MKPADPSSPASRPQPPAHPRETRYPLPDLLAEIELERDAGCFAMEKLNQAEIGKVFANHPRKRRAKKS